MLPGKKYAIGDYLALGLRYWWVVAITTSVCFFLALMYSASQKNSYQSAMTVQIIPQSLPSNIVQSTVMTKVEERVESLKAQVTSRTSLERVITEYDLYPDERAALPIEDVVNIMRNAITTDYIRQARHLPPEGFTLKFTYENAGLAAKVTAALGQQFIAQNAIERGNQAERNAQFLQSQVAEAKTRLEEHEAKVEAFRRAHAGRLPTQSDFNMQAIQATQNTLQNMLDSINFDRSRRSMLETTLNDAMALPMPTTPVQSQPTGAAAEAATGTLPLRQQLQLAKATLDRYESRLTNEHPDLRRQRRIVAELETRVAAEPPAPSGTTAASSSPVVTTDQLNRQEMLSQRRAEIKSLTGAIAFKEQEARRLQTKIAEHQARLEATPGVEADWIALTRDYQTLNTSYQDKLRKAEDAKTAADLERQNVGESFKIVDIARVPVNPIGPFRLQTNAIGLGAGLGLGIAIIALIFFTDTTFRSEADVLDVLALPVLAVVPFVVDSTEKRRRYWRKIAIGGALGVAVCVSGYLTMSMQLWRFLM